MRARRLRSPLSVFVIAAIFGCVFGPGFFVSSAGVQNQQSPRRGKNGTPDSSATPVPGNQGQTTAPVPAQNTNPSSTPSVGSSGPSGAPATNPGDGSAPADQSASRAQTSSQDEGSGSGRSAPPDRTDREQAPTSGGTGQTRPEPPPFDRPPVWTHQNPQSTRSTARRPDYDTGRDQDSSSQPPSDSQGGYNQPETGRGSSRPPVLERSPDLGPDRGGGSNGSSGRSQPPVLRRSGDDSSGDEASPPTSPSSRDRRGGESGGPPQSGGEPQSDTIKLDATLVDIPVVVSDRSGRFIPRLSKNDFYVTEDGVQQQVAFFGSEEVPFNVALLLDVSPSVSNSARDIQDAALAFINELRPEDKVMIVAFDERVRFLTDFTNDRREMTYAIENTRTGNGTSVYEAVYDTVANRLRYVQGRKAMILFSDGEDTTSRRVKYQDAIDLVSESDVLVYGLRYPDTGGYGPNVGFPRTRMPFPLPGTRLPFPFPFPWPGKGPWGHFDSGGDSSGGAASYWNGQWGRRGGGQRNYNRDFMRDITEAGGGPVYDAKTIGDMSRLARQIADELRHVYVVSYYPTNSLANGGYRTVRVSIVGRDDLAVRHRKGYYADAVTGKSTT